MTNYEKIMRDMTPEKLAEMILGGTFNTCKNCAFQKNDRCGYGCIDGIEKWLKQEETKNESV